MFYIVAGLTITFIAMFLLELMSRTFKRNSLKQCVEKGHQWEKLYETKLVGGQVAEARLTGYRCQRCDERRPWNFVPKLDE